MNPTHYTCDFADGFWLIFGPNVGPLQYYSHLPIIVLSLGLALFVFFQNKRGLESKILLGMVSFFAAWVFFDSVIWATNKSDVIMFMWSLQILVEPLVYASALYLLYVVTKKRDATFFMKGIFLCAYMPVLLGVPTTLTLSGFDLTQCLAEEGPIALYYTYMLEGAILLTMALYTFVAILQEKNRARRKEIGLLALGTMLFLFAFGSGNIIGSVTGDWQLAQYGLFGMPLFTALLAYSIIRYHSFNAQLIPSVALVSGLIILSFSLLFVKDVVVFRSVAAVTFVFVLVISGILLRVIQRDAIARARIEKLARDLGTANRGQEGLIHFIGHEVKGVLAKTAGITSLMLEGDFGTLTAKAKEILEGNLVSTREAVEIVQTILLSANLKNGTLNLKEEAFDLVRELRELVAHQTPAAKKKDISLVCGSMSTQAMVRGDKDMIMQHVFKNLIENALHYTPPGGKVEISLKDTDSAYLVEVTDTGIGLRPEDAQVLFTQGGRGDRSVKMNVNSTGYGLFFAREIMRAHGGDIIASSRGEGKGSTFAVTFDKREYKIYN